MTSGLTNATPTASVAAMRGPAAALPVGESNHVKPGQRWGNRYEVKDAVGEPGGHWYRAFDTAEGEEVLMRVTPAGSSAGRGAVWQNIMGVTSRHVQRPLVEHQTGERVEVWAAMRGSTLRSWRLAGGIPGPEQWLAVIRQLTEALEALHFAGVGHFSLNADTVYIHEGGSGPVVCLGFFETAVPCEGQELIAIPVDPFTAPPEAAGLFQHSPGDSLRAWDWWSLGRLIQELLLGSHVAGILPEGQTAWSLPAGAAALLTERQIPKLRAGAVELMPDLDQRRALLLRGLLTTAVTGRWRASEVKEWLAGGTPPDRYAAGRHEQFFRHHGRSYTVPEFARVLHASPDSHEAVRHLLATEEKDTLACFLKGSPEHEDYDQRLMAARELAGAVALRQFAEPLRQEIAAAVAWHGLAGGNFFWRGQALNDTGLRERLGSVEGFREWRAAMLALATPLVVSYISVYDSEAARVLERLVKAAGEVEALAVQSRWLKPDAPAEQARLWLAALEPDARLQAAHEQLHREYAAADDTAFQSIFTAEKPTRVMQVLIAWAVTDPRRFSLVTHREMTLRRQKALLTEGEGLTRLIFWLRLDRAMRAGPWLFGGRWFLVLSGLMLIALLAVHLPGPRGVALGLLPLVALAAARLGLNRIQSGLVGCWSPDSASWDWRAGPARSAAEVRALAKKHNLPPDLREAQAALKRVREELVKLTPEIGPVLLPPRPPWQAATWAFVGFGWLVVLGLAAGSVQHGLVQAPSWQLHAKAWQEAMAEKPDAKPAKQVETGDTKVSWPYKIADDPYELTVKGEFVPTGRQTAAAISRGKALIAPYKPETIRGLIAIYIPLEDGQGALLLFDGKKEALLGRTGVKINFVPFPKMWLSIGNQLALFIE